METKRFLVSVKRGWNNYCSAKCQYKNKQRRVGCECRNCGKGFEIHQSDARKGGGKYCSHHCQAMYLNKFRLAKFVLIKRTKLAARPMCKRKGCINRIGLKAKYYCSRECRSEFEKNKSYDAEVIFEIKEFFGKHGRVPLKAEMLSIYRKSRKAFKTWNNAVTAAGFEPIKTKFSKNWQAKDVLNTKTLNIKLAPVC